ncbi:MAG: cytidine deaminase [Deinococcota bacterium]
MTLDDVPQDLLKAARAARARAYVPYSQFAVGSALRTNKGTVFAGCNVENAAYGLSRCAEQSAVLAMVNAGETIIDEILVIGDHVEPVSPCGACRQIIWEFGKDTTVYMLSEAGEVAVLSSRELLPLGFILNS